MRMNNAKQTGTCNGQRVEILKDYVTPKTQTATTKVRFPNGRVMNVHAEYVTDRR